MIFRLPVRQQPRKDQTLFWGWLLQPYHLRLTEHFGSPQVHVPETGSCCHILEMGCISKLADPQSNDSPQTLPAFSALYDCLVLKLLKSSLLTLPPTRSGWFPSLCWVDSPWESLQCLMNLRLWLMWAGFELFDSFGTIFKALGPTASSLWWDLLQ